MTSPTAVLEEAGPAGSMSPELAANRLGTLSLLALSAWCGLLAGLLEVGTIVVRKQTFDWNRLCGMSRHFVWLIPVTNLCIFLGLGAVSCLAVLAWPRRGSRLSARLVGALGRLTAGPLTPQRFHP